MKSVLSSCKTRVEVTKAGNHDPNKRSAGEHPRDVAWVIGGNALAGRAIGDDDIGTIGDAGRAKGGAVWRLKHAVCDVDHLVCLYLVPGAAWEGGFTRRDVYARMLAVCLMRGRRDGIAGAIKAQWRAIPGRADERE